MSRELKSMKVSDFDYSLPRELIAQEPLPQRDESRMMVVFRRKGEIIHSRFQELPEFLNKGDMLVLNNTRVIPARTWGRKNDREIEFLFLREAEKGLWETLCRPARKVRTGDIIFFDPDFKARVEDAREGGLRTLRFSKTDVLPLLKKTGFAPLPPYIHRNRNQSGLRPLDLRRYQTVYARKPGAVAAPTAGLHFTPRILEEIKKKGVEVCFLTLNVGPATFQPVRVDRVEDHVMTDETYSISGTSAAAINKAKKESKLVTAVGTTVVRALESAAGNGEVTAGSRSTTLFIHPGYEFAVVDRLLTNFHLPKSTLLMLVSAFAGTDLIRKAYREAVRLKYRFFSYGDCMFII